MGKDAGLYCGSRLRKGEVFAYVGSIQDLKDLKVIDLQVASLIGAGRRGGGVWASGRYRGTALARKCTPLGPYSRPMPRVLGKS